MELNQPTNGYPFLMVNGKVCLFDPLFRFGSICRLRFSGYLRKKYDPSTWEAFSLGVKTIKTTLKPLHSFICALCFVDLTCICTIFHLEPNRNRKLPAWTIQSSCSFAHHFVHLKSACQKLIEYNLRYASFKETRDSFQPFPIGSMRMVYLPT